MMSFFEFLGFGIWQERQRGREIEKKKKREGERGLLRDGREEKRKKKKEKKN